MDLSLLKPNSIILMLYIFRKVNLQVFTQPSQEFHLPPQKEPAKKKKTLVLDLDETLVHSCFQPVDNVDIVLPVNKNKIQNDRWR